MSYMHFYVRLEELRLPQGAGLDTSIQMCMELNFWQLLAELNVDFRSHYTAFIDPNLRLIQRAIRARAFTLYCNHTFAEL